jgi:hypothetical protein
MKYIATFISALCIFALLLSSTSYAKEYLLEDIRPDVPLNDIEKSAFRQEIRALYKLGIIDGTSENKFNPDDSIDRAAFAKFIVNVFEISIDTSGEQFTDVDENHPFFEYIQSLKNAGVVQGFADGRYAPDLKVNRAEATKFIWEAAYISAKSTLSKFSCAEFTDISDSVFKEYICALARYNRNTDGEEVYTPIISGFGTGEYKPDEELTRAAMARIVLLAGTSIEKDTGDREPFIYFEGFERPFSYPLLEVEELDVVYESYSKLTVRWDSLHTVGDTSIDGYIIERRYVGEWEPVDNFSGAGAESQITKVKIRGVVTDGDRFTISIKTEDYDYTAVAGDTIEDVVERLYRLIESNSDYMDPFRGSDRITLVAMEPGRSIDVDVETTSTTATISEDTTQEDDDGAPIPDGLVLLAEIDANESTVVVLDRNLDEDTNYDYRVAPFKFLPYQFVEDEYTSQEELQSDTPNRNNMLIGPWEQASGETEKRD